MIAAAAVLLLALCQSLLLQTSQPIASAPATSAPAAHSAPAARPAASQATSPATREEPDDSDLVRQRRLTMLYLVLSTTAAGLLAFLVLSYLLLKILRRAAPHSKPKPSVYVDAWANYRLTQEEIDAATDEGSDGQTPDGRRE